MYRRRLLLPAGAPTAVLSADTPMILGKPRPTSCAQRQGSYVCRRPPACRRHLDHQHADDRFKHVVDLYLGGNDRRSALVLDRHRPTPLYRAALRPL